MSGADLAKDELNSRSEDSSQSSSAPKQLQAQLQVELLAHLEAICCDRDPLFAPLGHLAVRAYLDQQLGQWGDVTAEEFEYNGQGYCNLVLELPGRGGDPSSLDPVLIGAHYDAVHGSPGADDNGTGVAALLAMAAAFAVQPAVVPLRLVAFDAEEYGRLGSQVHAQLMAEEEGALRLMLSLEMLGYCSPAPQRYPADWMKYLYPKQGNFLALVGNPRAMGDLWKLKRSLQAAGVPTSLLPVPQRGEWLPRLRDSDHAAFWDCGCNAAMVTDTADLRNPHYHRGSDRIETLNLDFFARVTQGLIAGVRQLS